MRLSLRPTEAEPTTEDLHAAATRALTRAGHPDAAALIAALIDSLLEAHRLHLGELLYAEAERYTRGGFADGIRFAASCVKHPEKFLPAEAAPRPGD